VSDVQGLEKVNDTVMNMMDRVVLAVILQLELTSVYWPLFAQHLKQFVSLLISGTRVVSVSGATNKPSKKAT
jgi:hypothetical protein